MAGPTVGEVHMLSGVPVDAIVGRFRTTPRWDGELTVSDADARQIVEEGTAAAEELARFNASWREYEQLWRAEQHRFCVEAANRAEVELRRARRGEFVSDGEVVGRRHVAGEEALADWTAKHGEQPEFTRFQSQYRPDKPLSQYKP